MRRLTPEDRVRVERLSAVLRLADGLDRSRSQQVRAVKITVSDDAALVEILGDRPLDVEVYGSETKGTLFERVFGLELTVRQSEAGPEQSA